MIGCASTTAGSGCLSLSCLRDSGSLGQFPGIQGPPGARASSWCLVWRLRPANPRRRRRSASGRHSCPSFHPHGPVGATKNATPGTRTGGRSGVHVVGMGFWMIAIARILGTCWKNGTTIITPGLRNQYGVQKYHRNCFAWGPQTRPQHRTVQLVQKAFGSTVLCCNGVKSSILIPRVISVSPPT